MRNSELYVTARSLNGRLGHRLKSWLSGMIMAELYRITYAYSPIDPTRRRYDSSFDDFFGFKENCVSVESLEVLPDQVFEFAQTAWRGLSFDDVERLFESFCRESKGRRCLLVMANNARIHLQQVYEWEQRSLIRSGVYVGLIQRLRKGFHEANSTRKLYFEKNIFNVGVHIRRGDIARKSVKSSKDNERFIGIEYFEHIIYKIRKSIPGKVIVHFHVYTEKRNSIDVVSALKEYSDVTLHVGEDVRTDFYHLVKSNLLVLSAGSFTDFVGYLSHSIKIYLPHFDFNYLPADEFVPVNEKWDFDLGCIERSVRCWLDS